MSICEKCRQPMVPSIAGFWVNACSGSMHCRWDGYAHHVLPESPTRTQVEFYLALA